MNVFFIDQTICDCNSSFRCGSFLGEIDTPCWSPLVDSHLLYGLLYSEVPQKMKPLLMTSNLCINYDKITNQVEIGNTKITNNIKKIVIKDSIEDIYIIIKCNENFLELVSEEAIKSGIEPVDSITSDINQLDINRKDMDNVEVIGKNGFRWLCKKDKYDVKDFKKKLIVTNGYLRYVKRRRDFFIISRENMDSIAGFEYNIQNNMTKDDIQSLISVMPNDKLKLVFLEDGKYKNVLDMVSIGFDVIISDYPSKLSENGYALLPYDYYKNEDGCSRIGMEESGGNSNENSSAENFDVYIINLNEEKYANDYANKITEDSPRNETRGYIYHLLKCNEPLSTVLLQVHNNYMYTHFFQALRKSMKEQNFDKFVAKLE